MYKITVYLVFQCTLCLSIRVPVNWDNDSEVKGQSDEPNSPQYFQYTANKPQFAVDVAKFHDVKDPEKHFESYPIKPHSGLNAPNFGKHKLPNNENYKQNSFQNYVHNKESGYVNPITNSYEVYHPYKSEVPALQNIYKDPILHKIRNDVYDAKNKLQKYEHDAGESNISKDDYLENPRHTDRRKVPQRNIPASYEIHVPQRRPIYYKSNLGHHNRDNRLNQKLKHPWQQNHAKVTPMHYRPLKHHLHRLRQQHALTYDDERNEYPQSIQLEKLEDQPDGYDIFENGKENYKKIRNNFDEKINKATLKQKPSSEQQLEFQNNENTSTAPTVTEHEFVPVKSYSQVRKTETIKHVPKSAAFEDAENFEEIQNAPRLREAVKSSKNQVVYSEEGYEDSAYDHGGEQKHASENEGHGGFLKEHENSRGKYKIPSLEAGFNDESKSISRKKLQHGEKYSDEYQDEDKEEETEDFSENEQNYSDYIQNDPSLEQKDKGSYEKSDHEELDRNLDPDSNSSNKKKIDNDKNLNNHDIAKRETILPKLIKKYPYYLKDLKSLNKNSPLRYAENLKFIPRKKTDPSAFYNSRSTLQCPDIETKLDPIPEKFKKNGHPDDSAEDYDDNENTENDKSNKGSDDFENNQRLNGLGDKIDCLKIKYFGTDPLDSPFFKEELIDSPQNTKTSQSKQINTNHENENLNATNITSFLNDTRDAQPLSYNNTSYPNNVSFDKKKYKDNYGSIYQSNQVLNNTEQSGNNSLSSNLIYSHFFNKEDITQKPLVLRKKRSTSFNYEPYKVIKENKLHDSKKITTTGNVSPLLIQLQSSKISGKNNKLDNKDTYNFVDNIGNVQRRPQSELKSLNHKAYYAPVENKTSLTMEQYNERIKFNKNNISNMKKRSSPTTQSSSKPHLKTKEVQNIAASSKVERIIRTTTTKTRIKNVNNNEDYYDEYDDEDEEIKPSTTTTTTTTTVKPKNKKRIHLNTTKKSTQEQNIDDQGSEPLKLRLTTRFRTTSTTEKPDSKHSNNNNDSNFEDTTKSPKYREKKKKSTKTTYVTDTESYGDDNDDMKREEIDALIGVQHDMDDYMPTYEKEYLGQSNKHKDKNEKKYRNNSDSDEDEQDSESEFEIDDDDDDDDDDENSDGEENDDEESDDDEDESQENGNDGIEKYSKTYIANKDDKAPPKVESTTSEPTKRTLIRTTDVPTVTTSKILHSDQLKPVVHKKKIEIHKEIPVNKSSPHTTHFKQDIKEIEIIKQLEEPKKPAKTVQNNLEQLELYKNDNLAKEINELGGVEIFIDDLDLESGPKHGGNYRSISAEELEREQEEKKRSDTEASQSQARKSIEMATSLTPSRLKSRSDVIRSRHTNARHSTEKTPFSRQITKNGNGEASRGKSEKLIELKDEKTEDDYRTMHGGNFRSYNTRNNDRQGMHGGNYRSAKLILADKNQATATEKISTTSRSSVRRNRKNEAELLNSYAQAIPILTTAPSFTLDPSKRMYYYVEA